MADRTLSTYTEHAENGLDFTLTVERLSSGRPGLIFEIKSHHRETGGGYTSTCVVVEDGNALLAPVIEWLNA